MKFEELWLFLEENRDFFDKLAFSAEVKIDYENEKFSMGDTWSADPFYLITKLFRKKFEESSPSNDHEFTRINKILYAHGIKIPFGKREYDGYVNYENMNQRILSILETILGSYDGKFVIPTKEYSNKMFKDVSRDMENILSGLFVYEGKEARYYVDIYDRLTGFEVFLDSGSIFIPVKFIDVPRSAFNEDKLTTSTDKDLITVADILYTNSEGYENIVFIPEEYTDSIRNVAKYFNSFNIVNDNNDFIMNTIKSINTLSKKDPVITVNSEMATSYISSILIEMYLEHGSSSIAQMIDIARVVASMNKINRGIVIDAISADISGDVVDMLKTYIDGSNDDYIAKISELINNKDVEFVARIVRLNGDSSSIRFYNKKMRYFKDFNVDKNGIINELVPELGGFRFIASYCGINKDNTPSGFKTIDAFILYVILKVVHGEFGNLPLFDRFYGSGVHRIGEKIVFNAKNEVHGLSGRHSFDGVLFNASNIDVVLPKSRYTKSNASSAIDNLAERLKGFISSADNRHKLASIMIASSSIMPMLDRGNKAIISIYGAGLYTKDGFKQRIFRGCFRNANVVKTDSDFVIKDMTDGSTSFVVSDLNNKTRDILTKLASERFGTETTNRFRNTDSTVKTINTAPLFVFSDEPWIIEESFVFNFPARVGSEAGSFLYDTDDISSIIIQYAINNYKKVKAAEDKFVSKMRKKLNSKDLNSRHPYVDFFEKILPGMCLVDITGYMDGWDFHDMMYNVFFNDASIHNVMNIEKLILSLQNGSSKVEDKLFDSKLRMNQNGDMVAVDKIYHNSYVNKSDTDNFVLLFKKREVYDKIKDDININFVDFSILIDSLKSAILLDTAMRNWRVEHDKDKTLYNWYIELFGKDKDNFAAIKISKKLFYGL